MEYEPSIESDEYEQLFEDSLCDDDNDDTDLDFLLEGRSPTLSNLYFDWLEAEYFPHTSENPSAGDQNRVNQGMHFGTLSDPSTPLGYLAHICSKVTGLLPEQLQSRVYDQGIINLYDPGEGIGDHIDLLRFEDGICGFSFGGSASMRMILATDVERAARYAKEVNDEQGECVWARVRAGDLYAFAGDARYRWTHGFPKQIDGKDNVSGRRISVTLRKLCGGSGCISGL
ncbi:hypothetical protein IWW45_007841 [Coemansia sp. RSA 485]|nr:hypothetical protein IWW45_007841 [Coemansia sp. RSA 485]